MRRFRAILAQDGVETAEGFVIRDFPLGAFTWVPEELPLPIRFVTEDFGGHQGARDLGVMDHIERQGQWIVASGLLDDEGQGDDADARRDEIRRIGEGLRNKLSVDPGNGGVEVEETCEREDEDGWCEQVRVTFTRYSIGGATLVSIPALQGTLIELLPEEAEDGEMPTADEALEAIAAAAVAVEPDAWSPPIEWFDDPELAELTRHPVLTAEGRVYGHLAGWQDCHLNFPDRCETPWRSQAGYAYAHVSNPPHPDVPEDWRNAENGWCGVLSAVGGHWTTDPSDPRTRDWQAAQAHYDDPRSATAYVRFGEDEHGIWFAGALRPGVDREQVAMFRSHRLSGDWRRIDGHMELIAGCAVNVPGFVRSVAVAASAEGGEEALAAVVAGSYRRPEAAAAEAPCCDACAASGGSCGHGQTAGAATIVNNVGGLSPADRAMLRRIEAALDPTIRTQLRERMRASSR